MVKSYSGWHRADIIAALKKRGLILSRLSRQSGLSSTTLSNTLVRPWTKGEMRIAQVLNMKAERIWPSRYRDRVNNRPIQRHLRNKLAD